MRAARGEGKKIAEIGFAFLFSHLRHTSSAHDVCYRARLGRDVFRFVSGSERTRTVFASVRACAARAFRTNATSCDRGPDQRRLHRRRQHSLRIIADRIRRSARISIIDIVATSRRGLAEPDRLESLFSGLTRISCLFPFSFISLFPCRPEFKILDSRTFLRSVPCS